MDEAARRVQGQAAAIIYALAAPQAGAGIPAYLLHDVGGVSCVIAYTSLARLVECCGEHQPWLGVEIGALIADLREQGLPGPVVNLPLNPALWWTADGPPYRMPAPQSRADLAVTGTAWIKGRFG
jgi:hypothetical protein